VNFPAPAGLPAATLSGQFVAVLVTQAMSNSLRGRLVAAASEVEVETA